MKVLSRAVLAEERRYLCRVYFNLVPIIGVAFITTLLLASRVIWPPPAVVPRFLGKSQTRWARHLFIPCIFAETALRQEIGVDVQTSR